MKAAIVGGGIAGVSLGYELASNAEVVVLEQEPEMAYHTTGRSAAMYLESYGGKIVRALTAASGPGFEELERESASPELLRPLPVLWTADEEYRQCLAAMVETIRVLRPVDASEALTLCPVLRADRVIAGAEDPTAMEIDVLAVHAAYVAGIRRRGGTIRTSARFKAANRDGDGWQIMLDTGETLSADVVVNAAGAWADGVASMASQAPVGLRPLRRTIFTSPIKGSYSEVWPFVCDVGERFYFRREHDYVLVSPADEVPDEPRDVRPDEIDIASAIDVMNEHTTLALRSVRTAWAGLRTFAPDRVPVIGMRDPLDKFLWFAGQGGYGIQMAPALARAGASLLFTNQLPADLLVRELLPSQLSPNRFWM